jgi:hypothetical protein
MTFKPFPELAALGDPQNGKTALQRALSDFVYSTDGELRFRSLQTATFLMHPEFVSSASFDKETGRAKFITTDKWNPWLERCFRAFTNEKYAVRIGDSVVRVVVLTGCGGAGKTFAAGLYTFMWWLPMMDKSIGILTSTTKDMIRNRIWSVIHHLHDGCQDLITGQKIEIGHMVDSMMKLMVHKGNAKNSISAYAVAHGETLKAIDNLKGMHAKRMLLVIDEANGTPEAIFQIIANYRKGCEDLTIIVIGNPSARMDPHGRSLTPRDGWGSVNMDTHEWPTEGVSEWQMDPGIALRFDGFQSPNVLAKKNLYPYIYGYQDYIAACKRFEEKGGNFNYYTQDRGWWLPDGFSNTIFNEQLIIRCDAVGSHFTFDGERETVAFLDPAFGGDDCVLQFGELGKVNGSFCLQLTDWLEVPIDPEATAHDIDYQIARRVQQECVVRRIKPHCFGLDATGIGRGVGAIMASEWSPQIQYMNWGSGATDRPSAQNDGRPAREVYQHFAAELWFSAREFLEAQQIKGFSRESINQFCSRLFDMTGKKYKLETKADMKERVRYSPDHADAVVGCLEVARRNGLGITGKIAKVAESAWTKQVQEAQEESALDIDQIVTVSDGGGWSEKVDW